MKESVGRSQSIYFNSKEAEQIDSEASALDISSKDLIKAKTLANDGNIKVVRRVSFGHDVNLSLLNIADAFFEISQFFDDVANDDVVSGDLAMIREKHDETMNEFRNAIVEMKKKIERSHRAC